MPINTMLTIEYADAGNNKATELIVLKGRVYEAQLRQIKAALDAGEFFVPHELKLPNPAAQFVGYDSFPSEELDHGYCRIREVELDYPEFRAETDTHDSPTVPYTAATFILALHKAAFDPGAEFERMKTLTLPTPIADAVGA